MYFRTWSAWSGITHLPEVVVLVAVDDMVCRHMLQPELCSLVVASETFCLVAFEYSDIEIGRIELKHINKILPCHIDSAFLEVVAERPVAEHLEHGMVVCVVAYFLKVVMLSAYTQTLL